MRVKKRLATILLVFLSFCIAVLRYFSTQEADLIEVKTNFQNGNENFLIISTKNYGDVSMFSCLWKDNESKFGWPIDTNYLCTLRQSLGQKLWVEIKKKKKPWVELDLGIQAL